MAESVEVTATLLRDWQLPSGSDKNSRGRVVVVGGSDRTPGAVLLAAEAALRVGAGKVQLVTTASVAAPCAVALPEALVVAADSEAGSLAPGAAGTVAELAGKADCLLLGPGLDDPAAAAALVEATLGELQGWDGVVVLDALALAYVREHPDGGALVKLTAALTPNEEELALSLGAGEDEAGDREVTADDAARLARRSGAVVSSGGGTTWVAHPDGRRWHSDAGGPGLGTAGSGDVHAGVLAGVAARCGSPEQAAVWAAHLHGTAGDRLAVRIGRLGFLARDIAVEVTHVLADLDAGAP